MGIYSVVANAAGNEAVISSMEAALTGVKSDATGAINAVAPIGIGLMGVFLVWRYGTRFFKSIAK